ncbi:MAG TPA: SGNH/GDSL hydrolase family protein [Xanthobacteraceae bacterium]
MTRTGRGNVAAALFSAAFLCAGAAPAVAESQLCQVPAELTRLERPLAHTGQRLAAGQPVKIIAIGSSSTAGAGASSAAASYPGRLAVELAAIFPGVPITVVNRGINGQDAAEMVARFRRDVIEEKPDLVIWQLGTNAALRDMPAEQISRLIQAGVRMLTETGADVLLVDPQFVPRVISKPETEGMVTLIAATARRSKVGVFRRFAIMKHWREVGGLSFEAFTSPDGLHMNDWGYRCWAKLMCAAIADAATRATTSAELAPAAQPDQKPGGR